MRAFSIKGNVVDIHTESIFSGEVLVDDERIVAIRKVGDTIDDQQPFITPGFVDSHVHIESSMLIPSEFARLAVVHGTVATVSDPHEIANVCGTEGVEFMIENGNSVHFKFYFGAPSCVPATAFETAGAAMDSDAIEQLLQRNEIRYLSEMMNFPGVINGDEQALKKIEAALKLSKPVDGHAPGLRGEPLSKYIASGISTDHECFTIEEALEKLSLGMKIIIREGSAARNFDALIDLLNDYPHEVMFCSDDKHPDSLVENHIKDLCRRALSKNIPLFNILKAACVNPVVHYNLDVGLLRVGDPADFILVDDLQSFSVQKTFINGRCVAEKGKTNISSKSAQAVNRFHAEKVTAISLGCTATDMIINGEIPVIEALDGQLITHKLMIAPLVQDGKVIADPSRDILKIVVVNRYRQTAPAVAFIKNFGLKRGAIASSVAHDSHNIISVGVSDEYIADAINLIIDCRGGISAVDDNRKEVLPLPVAGLMSLDDGYRVAEAYTGMDRFAKDNGSTLSAPFMTLSFMALLVIPSLKLSDRGLFDADSFNFVSPESFTD